MLGGAAGGASPSTSPRATAEAKTSSVRASFQRSFSSNTLRGVHRDAYHVVDALARQPRSAAVA